MCERIRRVEVSALATGGYCVTIHQRAWQDTALSSLDRATCLAYGRKLAERTGCHFADLTAPEPHPPSDYDCCGCAEDR